MPLRAVDEIRASGLFRELDDQTLSALVRGAFLQTFPMDVTLYGAGMAVTFLHAILWGDVELGASHGGRHCTTIILGTGRLLPLDNIAGDDMALCHARTASPARIALLPLHTVQKLLGTTPALALALLRESNHLTHSLLRELRTRSLQKSHERLASWILDRLETSSDGMRLALNIPKKLLASSIGVSQATLSRDIALLSEHKVEFRGRTILVHDRRELERAAVRSEETDWPTKPGIAGAPASGD